MCSPIEADGSAERKMAKRKLDSLLEYVRANGMGEADILALHTMFWRIWAHPDLIGFQLVADSLRQIGLLATRTWNEQLTLFGMERWPSLLKWLADHRYSICSEVGIDEGIKSIRVEKKPMERHGFEADAVYSALCQRMRSRAMKKNIDCCRETFYSHFRWRSES
jgi:hypothetical protein